MPPVEPPLVFPEVFVAPAPSIPSDILAAMVAIEEIYVSRRWLAVPACIINLPIDASDVPDDCPFFFDTVISLVYMRMMERGWDVDPVNYTNLGHYLRNVLLLDRAKEVLEDIGACVPHITFSRPDV